MIQLSNKDIKNRKENQQYTKLSNLTGSSFSSERNAFIGTCGNGKKALYIVSHSNIILAESTVMNWSDPQTEIVVEKFVNLVIEVCDI